MKKNIEKRFTLKDMKDNQSTVVSLRSSVRRNKKKNIEMSFTIKDMKKIKDMKEKEIYRSEIPSDIKENIRKTVKELENVD